MTERGKVLNPEYSIFRDQPIPGASPLRINTLLYGDLWAQGASEVNPKSRLGVVGHAVFSLEG